MEMNMKIVAKKKKNSAVIVMRTAIFSSRIYRSLVQMFRADRAQMRCNFH